MDSQQQEDNGLVIFGISAGAVAAVTILVVVLILIYRGRAARGAARSTKVSFKGTCPGYF